MGIFPQNPLQSPVQSVGIMHNATGVLYQ